MSGHMSLHDPIKRHKINNSRKESCRYHLARLNKIRSNIMIPLKVLHWNLTQASDSCPPHLWQTQGHDGQQPRQPPHLPRVSWAHTALRHSTSNKTSRSSSVSASAVVNENPTRGFRWVQHYMRARHIKWVGLRDIQSCLETWPRCSPSTRDREIVSRSHVSRGACVC